MTLPPYKRCGFWKYASDRRSYTKQRLKVAFCDEFTVVQTEPFKIAVFLKGRMLYEVQKFLPAGL